jgi:hypothetical protein
MVTGRRKAVLKVPREAAPQSGSSREAVQHSERSVSGANLGSFQDRFPTAWLSFRYLRRFFFLGGGGGGLAAAIAAGEGTAGAGMSRLIAYCWPIVQKLVVIQ